MTELFWSDELTLLDELLSSDELELVVLPLVDVEVDSPDVEVEVVGESDVLAADLPLELAAAAVCVTPAMRPMVTAPAATAVPALASAMRRGSRSAECRLLMTTTMGSATSAARHSNVKSVLTCDVSR
jgi:hypothetical protein